MGSRIEVEYSHPVLLVGRQPINQVRSYETVPTGHEKVSHWLVLRSACILPRPGETAPNTSPGPGELRGPRDMLTFRTPCLVAGLDPV